MLDLVVVGLNIKSAPVEALEKLSIHHSEASLRLGELMGSAAVHGAVILSTCNRLELYASARDAAEAVRDLRKYLVLQEHLYDFVGDAAVRHLYRVVSGLDSLVLGETEILGQVARAYELALGAGVTDKVLNVWFQRALGVGKLVRTEAGIDQYHTSVGRIAVDLAELEMGSIRDKQILILGAGEMSELGSPYSSASMPLGECAEALSLLKR